MALYAYDFKHSFCTHAHSLSQTVCLSVCDSLSLFLCLSLSLSVSVSLSYLNDIFWVIYDRLAKFTQIGAYSLSSAERNVALAQEESPAFNASVAGAALPQGLKMSGRFFGWHAVTLPPARRFPSA
jgi:hypothetical protein